MNTILGEAVTVERGGTDKYGERATDSTHEVEVVFAWGHGRSAGKFHDPGKDRSESAGMTAQVYVARGTDLQVRDRIVRGNGEKYRVVGHPLWDGDFALGDGYCDDVDAEVAFQVESLNG